MESFRSAIVQEIQEIRKSSGGLALTTRLQSPATLGLPACTKGLRVRPGTRPSFVQVVTPARMLCITGLLLSCTFEVGRDLAARDDEGHLDAGGRCQAAVLLDPAGRARRFPTHREARAETEDEGDDR